MTTPYTIERNSPQLMTVRVDNANYSNFEQWFMLQSDHHWDNPKCRRKILKRHLDLAAKRSAGIIMGGDFFCAMQGKYDKRGTKSDVRPEHNNGRYLDSLVDTAADWLEPWKDNLIAMGNGNHETAITKRHETSLIDRTTAELRKRGSSVQGMGYAYWVRFQLTRGTQRKSYLLNVWHGSGGGGPVTRDVIKSNRLAVTVPDADMVMFGHTHDAWAMPIARERVSQSNKISIRNQWFIKTPTFKEEYLCGNGFHRERGGPPKPIGSYWIRFTFEQDRFRLRVVPEIEDEIFEDA